MRTSGSAVRVVGEALGDVWGDLWTALVCDFLWLLAIVLIVPGPPATVALFAFANRQAHAEATQLRDFWEALRRYWAPAWRWGLVNLAVIFVLAGDAYLTGRGNAAGLGYFIRGFYLACLAAWLLVQLYALPFLLEQEKPSVRSALRNGAAMLGRNPLFSVVLGLSLLLLCALGTALFLLSLGFGGMLVAAAANRAVLDRLAAQGRP